jgi:hypothetical protein
MLIALRAIDLIENETEREREADHRAADPWPPAQRTHRARERGLPLADPFQSEPRTTSEKHVGHGTRTDDFSRGATRPCAILVAPGCARTIRGFDGPHRDDVQS